MQRFLLLLLLALLLVPLVLVESARAQNGCVRLSWGTCDPQIFDRDYTSGTQTYLLVVSGFGLSAANTGIEAQVRIGRVVAWGGPEVPDAWRFDDAGCHHGSGLSLNTNAFSKFCPAMKGQNSSAGISYTIDSDGTAIIRLSSSYDSFAPVPTTRYTLWQILFNHTSSSVGPTPPDGSTCGGVELCEDLWLESARLHAVGGDVGLPWCEVEGYFPCSQATWNGGCYVPDYYPPCDGPVRTEPATWGKLKALYR